MRLLLKALVVLAPIAILLLGLRMCTGGAGDRWLMRVREVDDAAVLALDRPEIVAIAPNKRDGADAGEYALEFRKALAENYSDLLGKGDDQRFVLVIFSGPEMVRLYAGRNAMIDRRALGDVLGYTDPTRNAVYLPPEGGFMTLRHEIVHLLMGQETEGRVRFSPWLMEGLAQYFERYNPPKPPLFPPHGRPMVRTILRGEPPDIARLIRLQSYSDFLVQDGQRNYIVAQLLIAYLLERKRDALREYIQAEKNHVSGRYELFVRIVGDPRGDLGRAVQAYLAE